MLGYSQNHLAVAGGCRTVFFVWGLRRTHPLPRGGSDCVQAGSINRDVRDDAADGAARAWFIRSQTFTKRRKQA